MFDRQIPELARQWRVVRFDFPGHGGAPAHPAHSVADVATRLLATLDGLGVQRFGYAGCALGGAVGIELALRHPERVASLALIAASPRFGTPDEFRQRGVVVRSNGLDPIARTAPERWFTAGYAAAQPAITEWAVQMVRTTDPGCYIAACEALAAFDVRAELGRIGVPTLVLVGSEDAVAGPAEARTLVAGIPDARLAVVPGASHLVPVEQPAAVTDLLVRHFSTAWQPGFVESSTGQIAMAGAFAAPVAGPVTGTFMGPATGTFTGAAAAISAGPAAGTSMGPVTATDGLAAPFPGALTGAATGTLEETAPIPFARATPVPFAGPPSGPFADPAPGRFAGPASGPFAPPSSGPFAGAAPGPFAGPAPDAYAGGGPGAFAGADPADVARPVPADPPQWAPPVAEIGPAPDRPASAESSDRYDTGLKIRREVLGDAHVDEVLERADDFSADFQDLATRYAWGEIWDRPGLDRRTRSCVTLTALVAGGHLEELAAHTRAALRNGLTPAEIKEVLLQAAVYCGLPAANRAFRVAQEVVREETTPAE
ncbi:alpha/beta fold hydrolase [Streptomyces mangrovisoli]|uniref:alpha/beta fold hydrolase n=1 Tax=Streptomyces mangrovisoli TaxID=1428628 RepID=UPI003B84AA05